MFSHPYKMKTTIFFVLAGLTLVLAASRSKRAAYDLPDGAELIVGAIRTTFFCSSDGYFADVDNNCQIFHICHTAVHADGTSEMQQWSFFCGNQTIFNQFSLSCAYPEESVPCGNARDFLYLNANLRTGPNIPFHTDQDFNRARALTPGWGSSVYRPSAPTPNRPFRSG